ncbi:ammonia-dependent NAD(+) synthetase [Paenalcaligenes hominis]|uniref:ammonia-dependent NAD(+) synthetase n=1 Tax=Paenalcaligenes hominis TaxID=643674 RepID=UPI003526B066
MLNLDQKQLQQRIITELGVKARIDPAHELEQRIQFIKNYLRHSKARSLVIGISGGIDSLVVGYMAQLAVEQLRQEGVDATFIALRLPYAEQRDAADADAAIRHIQPDRCLELNIQLATDAVMETLLQAKQGFRSESHQDFIKGNVKARQRMIYCYAVAGAESGLVLGSDQAAEVLMGFFTKYGDGAADLMPLAGLTKSQVRELATQCGVPDALTHKVPTADLESLTPLQPDEDAFGGVTYHDIDAFLTGQPVSVDAFESIIEHYTRSAHKRLLPASPLTFSF